MASNHNEEQTDSNLLPKYTSAAREQSPVLGTSACKSDAIDEIVEHIRQANIWIVRKAPSYHQLILGGICQFKYCRISSIVQKTKSQAKVLLLQLMMRTWQQKTPTTWFHALITRLQNYPPTSRVRLLLLQDQKIQKQVQLPLQRKITQGRVKIAMPCAQA